MDNDFYLTVTIITSKENLQITTCFSFRPLLAKRNKKKPDDRKAPEVTKIIENCTKI